MASFNLIRLCDPYALGRAAASPESRLSAAPFGFTRCSEVAAGGISRARRGFQFEDRQTSGRNQAMAFVGWNRGPQRTILFCFRRQGLAIVMEQSLKLLNENFLR